VSRVRLFAALRDLAGSGELEVDAPDVGTLTRELAARYGEEFERILAAGSVVVGDERADPGHPLGPEDEVALLPPVSGGGEEVLPHRYSRSRARRREAP
jgi:molybdopterin synthase sulfur carrier subunit